MVHHPQGSSFTIGVTGPSLDHWSRKTHKTPGGVKGLQQNFLDKRRGGLCEISS